MPVRLGRMRIRREIENNSENVFYAAEPFRQREREMKPIILPWPRAGGSYI